jgi:serine/threonine-protein kinase
VPGGTASPELIERFLREAKVTGQLEHPNIVPVYEIAARDDGSVFYTMKLVRGKTMAHRLLAIQRDPGLSPQQKLAERLKLLDPYIDICNAVAYAHSRGVIHRDLKPANIMLGEFGETLVLDWGLARVHGQQDSSTVRRKAVEQAFSPSLVQEDAAGTLAGAVLGTPAYMPPEQARGELDKLDDRADVYALGAILYEILAGRPPYEGANARDVLPGCWCCRRNRWQRPRRLPRPTWSAWRKRRWRASLTSASSQPRCWRPRCWPSATGAS